MEEFVLETRCEDDLGEDIPEEEIMEFFQGPVKKKVCESNGLNVEASGEKKEKKLKTKRSRWEQLKNEPLNPSVRITQGTNLSSPSNLVNSARASSHSNSSLSFSNQVVNYSGFPSNTMNQVPSSVNFYQNWWNAQPPNFMINQLTSNFLNVFENTNQERLSHCQNFWPSPGFSSTNYRNPFNTPYRSVDRNVIHIRPAVGNLMDHNTCQTESVDKIFDKQSVEYFSPLNSPPSGRVQLKERNLALPSLLDQLKIPNAPPPPIISDLYLSTDEEPEMTENKVDSSKNSCGVKHLKETFRKIDSNCLERSAKKEVIKNVNTNKETERVKTELKRKKRNKGRKRRISGLENSEGLGTPAQRFIAKKEWKKEQVVNNHGRKSAGPRVGIKQEVQKILQDSKPVSYEKGILPGAIAKRRKKARRSRFKCTNVDVSDVERKKTKISEKLDVKNSEEPVLEKSVIGMEKTVRSKWDKIDSGKSKEKREGQPKARTKIRRIFSDSEDSGSELKSVTATPRDSEEIDIITAIKKELSQDTSSRNHKKAHEESPVKENSSLAKNSSVIQKVIKKDSEVCGSQISDEYSSSLTSTPELVSKEQKRNVKTVLEKQPSDYGDTTESYGDITSDESPTASFVNEQSVICTMKEKNKVASAVSEKLQRSKLNVKDGEIKQLRLSAVSDEEFNSSKKKSATELTFSEEELLLLSKLVKGTKPSLKYCDQRSEKSIFRRGPPLRKSKQKRKTNFADLSQGKLDVAFSKKPRINIDAEKANSQSLLTEGEEIRIGSRAKKTLSKGSQLTQVLERQQPKNGDTYQPKISSSVSTHKSKLKHEISPNLPNAENLNIGQKKLSKQLTPEPAEDKMPKEFSLIEIASSCGLFLNDDGGIAKPNSEGGSETEVSCADNNDLHLRNNNTALPTRFPLTMFSLPCPFKGREKPKERKTYVLDPEREVHLYNIPRGTTKAEIDRFCSHVSEPEGIISKSPTAVILLFKTTFIREMFIRYSQETLFSGHRLYAERPVIELD